MILPLVLWLASGILAWLLARRNMRRTARQLGCRPPTLKDDMRQFALCLLLGAAGLVLLLIEEWRKPSA